MNEAAKQQHKHRLEQSAGRLAHLLRLNAPDEVLCAEIALLVKKATLAFGAMAWKQIGEKLTAPVRTYYGECRDCCGPIPSPKTDQCEHCEAKEDDEMRETL